jgi:glutaredoxin-related protein
MQQTRILANSHPSKHATGHVQFSTTLFTLPSAGGSDIVAEMDESGELKKMVAEMKQQEK